jgi:hypothetical protein
MADWGSISCLLASPNDPVMAMQARTTSRTFPCSAATLSPADVTVSGSLNSLPNQTFTIEFFGSDACDPSGHGEGQGQIANDLTTNASGSAS